MRIAKHFYKLFLASIARIRCKHEEFYKASCPFTEMTYTNCIKCWKRLEVSPINE